MEIKIRKANKLDLDTLRVLEQGVIEAERPFDATLGDNPIHYYDLEGLLENPSALLLVATHKNTIISCGYGLEKSARHFLNHEKYAYLGFMFTVPEYRRQGLNARILVKLKSWAIARGLEEIRLTVYNENSAALRAYEKVGFKRHMIEMRLPASD